VEYQWDFNTPGGLPHGFANEVGDGLRRLLAQAIGQPDPDAPAQAPPAEHGEAEEPAPVGEEGPPPGAVVPPPGEPAAAAPVAEAPPAASDPINPPRRRHGGALPV
jgi:hypothetical protein